MLLLCPEWAEHIHTEHREMFYRGISCGESLGIIHQTLLISTRDKQCWMDGLRFLQSIHNALWPEQRSTAIVQIGDIWASYQIRKIAGRMRRECRERFPRQRLPATDFKGNPYSATPTCITARDACLDRKPAVSGKTFPVFPVHEQTVILRIW